MRFLALFGLLVSPALADVGAKPDSTDSTLLFYGGPAYHFPSPSAYSSYLDSEFGLDIDDPNYRGGIIGIMHRRSSKQFRDFAFAVYSMEGRGYRDGISLHFEYTAYSLEATLHRVLKGELTFLFSSGAALVMSQRKVGIFENEDSLFAWPISAGFRLRSRGLLGGYYEVRYRYLGLLNTTQGVARHFNLGGLFLGTGFVL